MAEFTPITTQEEFDAAISKRIMRERERYSDYDEIKKQYEALTKEKSAYSSKAETDEKTIKDLTERLESAEKEAKTLRIDKLRTDIAIEKKIPISFKNRLSGEDEDAIREDADALCELLKSANDANLPLHNNESGGADERASAFSEMLKGLNLNSR